MTYSITLYLYRGMIMACLLALALIAPGWGQNTVSTGGVQGTVTDPTGAAVPAAQVTLVGKATGQTVTSQTNQQGGYTFGGLIPGQYQVRIEAKGFQTAQIDVTVQVGQTATANAQIEIGTSTQVVEVEAQSVGVNTEQATVSGVLTSQQIDNLPINGRNFLDLAQLEPGVQIQDGTNFDPTKVGYSSISFGGRFGRTARINVDGLDVSDETVGTTTQDIPSSGIQEFQISQSNLDLSNELTSSGSVNVVTRSGSNEVHGEAFYSIRDDAWGAMLPHPPGLLASYQRNQFGGRFGGPIIKDKLFFFMDAERTKQDSFIPVQYAAPFQAFSGGFTSPFRETEPMGRLDWQVTKNLRVFYEFRYFGQLAEATFFSSSLQPYKNKNYTRTHIGGAEWTTGQWTHSFRVGRMKFENGIADAALGSGLPLANIGVNLDVINGPQTGPNLLAPQATLQLDHQVKYDGGRTFGNHFLRFGVDFNNITVGGFASFFKLAPQVQTNFSPADATAAAAGPFPGGAGNPLNYPVDIVILGDGQGYSTENPALGYPAGRLGPDNRLGMYVGDTWKVRRNLTLNYGLRYNRDTGRTDSDLGAIAPLNSVLPGWGNPVQQPNKNFAPQIGVAWDVNGKGKTVIRAGSGLFFENVIFNNVLFDRPLRLQSGAFLQTPLGCNFGTAAPIPIPGGTLTAPAGLCSETVGQAATGLAQLQQQYQAAVPFSLTSANPAYLGNDISSGFNVPLGLFAPNYKTPRSLQMNVGIQRELHPGTVLTVDYIRNVNTHSPLGIDINHTGDARYFNQSAAQAAINTTLAQCGATTVAQALAGPCASGPLAGQNLTIANFANNGLADPALDGGSCMAIFGIANCAFGGINPTLGSVPMLEPIARSVYNGLDVKLTHQSRNPLPGIRNANFTVSYSLSRFVSPGGTTNNSTPGSAGNNDQDFVLAATDNNNPLGFTGPSSLDRTNQLSFGGFFDLPRGFNLSMIGHFYSGLPVTLIVPSSGLGAAEIFATDFTGDGTVQDILPGTKIGSFNRSIGSVSALNQVINNYDTSVANQPTPAGAALVSAGLFTVAQLQQLGAVAPTVQAAPPGEVGVGNLRDLDATLSWAHKFGERFEIQPSVAFFNVCNFTNYDLPPNIISGLLNGSAGSVNGTIQGNRITNRVGTGTGVFALGAPRAIEFGMRLSF